MRALFVLGFLVSAAALRLLMAAAGSGGGFILAPQDPDFEAVVLTTPGEGGWVWFGSNRAIRNDDETIAGYITGGGDVKAIRIDNATRAVVETTTLYDNFLVDDHEPPSFVVRGDGVIMTAFAYHVGELYVGIGDSPGVLPAQADVTNITSQAGGDVDGDSGYTYASIVYLPDEDRYYVFARYHDDSVPYLVETHSDDDGATWSAHTVIRQITYHMLAVNGTDRIDFALSDHPLYGQGDNPAVHTSVYHIYYDGSWHESDGSSLTPVIGNTADTRVYDGTTSRGWIWDIAIGADDNPRIVYVVYDETFPSGSWHYEWARWTGSAWETHEVSDAGGTITVGAAPEHGQDYAGGIVLDHEDPDVVFFSMNAGGSFQLYRGVTSDDGDTWEVLALTSDGDKNVRPMPVVGHAGGNVQALALYGTYTDYFNYSQGIKVIGPE